MHEVVRLTSASNGGFVISTKEAVINLVEAAYNLELGSGEWLPNLLETGRPVFDLGLGFAGGLWGGASNDGQPRITQMHVGAGPPDLPFRYIRAAQAAGPDLVAQTSHSRTGSPNVLSEDRERWPGVYDALTKNVGCEDMLTLFAVDPDLHGATLTNKAASEVIREAAVRVDRARGGLRKTNPEEALELWHGLVRGRWSLVDWFDTDGRRLVLAKPNAPNIGDPRGLTEREHQVATYAALGESNKLLGYRFGISPPRVSKLLNSAMHKLGVKTQAQLIEKMRGPPGRPNHVC